MFMILFVIMASRYIQIRQLSLLSKMYRINRKLTSKQLKGKHALYWSQYLSVNREMLQVCKHIKANSRYWGPFLTIMFPYYIFINCYLMYMVIVIPNAQILERSLFLGILSETVVFFCMLINECAKVVKCNDKMVVENRRF